MSSSADTVSSSFETGSKKLLWTKKPEEKEQPTFMYCWEKIEKQNKGMNIGEGDHKMYSFAFRNRARLNLYLLFKNLKFDISKEFEVKLFTDHVFDWYYTNLNAFQIQFPFKEDVNLKKILLICVLYTIPDNVCNKGNGISNAKI